MMVQNLDMVKIYINISNYHYANVDCCKIKAGMAIDFIWPIYKRNC